METEELGENMQTHTRSNTQRTTTAWTTHCPAAEGSPPNALTNRTFPPLLLYMGRLFLPLPHQFTPSPPPLQCFCLSDLPQKLLFSFSLTPWLQEQTHQHSPKATRQLGDALQMWMFGALDRLVWKQKSHVTHKRTPQLWLYSLTDSRGQHWVLKKKAFLKTRISPSWLLQ